MTKARTIDTELVRLAKALGKKPVTRTQNLVAALRREQQTPHAKAKQRRNDAELSKAWRSVVASILEDITAQLLTPGDGRAVAEKLRANGVQVVPALAGQLGKDLSALAAIARRRSV